MKGFYWTVAFIVLVFALMFANAIGCKSNPKEKPKMQYSNE